MPEMNMQIDIRSERAGSVFRFNAACRAMLLIWWMTTCLDSVAESQIRANPDGFSPRGTFSYLEQNEVGVELVKISLGGKRPQVLFRKRVDPESSTPIAVGENVVLPYHDGMVVKYSSTGAQLWAQRISGYSGTVLFLGGRVNEKTIFLVSKRHFEGAFVADLYLIDIDGDNPRVTVRQRVDGAVRVLAQLNSVMVIYPEQVQTLILP